MASCEMLDSSEAPKLPIYLVAGAKGGVGKSMVALVLIDQLRLQGKPVLYFETDTSNPDVWFCLERDPEREPGEPLDGIVMYAIKIDEEDAWLGMANLIDAHPEHVVVIGTASRTSEAVRNYGPVLRETMASIGRKLVTLWVIDEQRDSIGQLVEHMAVFADNETHVIKNSRYGADSFSLYDQSQLRQSVERRGGSSLLMPRLALSVVRALYSDRLAISQAVDALPLGNRFALLNFRNECRRVFQPVLGG